MVKKSVFLEFKNWLRSTEMFARPSKQLPGKWNLVEYFIEPEKELVNIKEDKLKAENQFWEIEFAEGKYIQKSNLSIEFIRGLENGSWGISKNYLTIINPTDFRKNIEFQFAIEKGILKLLRKDAIGRIEFFGFFKKIDSK